MNYTYLLRCGDGSLYCGWTNDLSRRLDAHNRGAGAKYTRSRRPVRLVYWEVFDTRQAAMRREAAIKRLSREEKLALISAFEKERTKMDVREKLHDGSLYLPMDPALQAEQLARLDLVWEYNQIRPSDLARREALLREMFAELGEGCYVEPPFYANFGGAHVHFGKGVYANYNLTLVDDTHIYVGNYTMFGPGVIVATAGHPLLPALRERGFQYNAPVHIGQNCWIGAGAILLPGVTVGENTVIGAGSVVTRDVPANVVAVGSPCRVLREIGDRDREYYFRDRRISWDDPALAGPEK